MARVSDVITGLSSSGSRSLSGFRGSLIAVTPQFDSSAAAVVAGDMIFLASTPDCSAAAPGSSTLTFSSETAFSPAEGWTLSQSGYHWVCFQPAATGLPELHPNLSVTVRPFAVETLDQASSDDGVAVVRRDLPLTIDAGYAAGGSPLAGDQIVLRTASDSSALGCRAAVRVPGTILQFDGAEWRQQDADDPSTFSGEANVLQVPETTELGDYSLCALDGGRGGDPDDNWQPAAVSGSVGFPALLRVRTFVDNETHFARALAFSTFVIVLLALAGFVARAFRRGVPKARSVDEILDAENRQQARRPKDRRDEEFAAMSSADADALLKRTMAAAAAAGETELDVASAHDQDEDEDEPGML